MATSRASRSGSRRPIAVERVELLEYLDRLRSQLAVRRPVVGLGDLSDAVVELGVADLAVLGLLGRLELGPALGILDRVEALGSRARLAGESEFYGRRFATGVVCPAVRASGFRITGGA